MSLILSSDVIIAPTSKKFLDQILSIEEANFTNPWTRKGFEAELDNPNSVFIAALSNKVVLGYAVMLHILEVSFINNLSVGKKFQRQGVGKAMLNYLNNYGLEHSVDFITLEVRVSNHKAIALYRDCGFIDICERKNFYSSPVEDALVLTKYINSGGDQNENTGH